MRKILTSILLLINLSLFSQVYSFHLAKDLDQKYDSAWAGFSERGVIYLDFFQGDSSKIKILDRDSVIINVYNRNGIYNVRIGDIILSKTEKQWGPEWVDDYFEYTRDLYNSKIEFIENKNGWLNSFSGKKYPPVEIMPYFK